MKIVFYDSYCGLCHFAISFLLRLDVLHQLKFAPINGDTFNSTIPNHYRHIDSVFLYFNNQVYIKSDAIITSVILIRPYFFWVKILYLIPKNIRDHLYDVIARNRKRSTTCFMYPDQKDRFLP